MPLQFTSPIYLLLLPPALAFAWWAARRSLADLSPFRRRLAMGLRFALLVLVIGALAGTQLVRSSRSLSTMFVLDVSESVPQELRQAGLRYLEEAAKGMREEDSAGLVVFGGDASLELSPSAGAKIKRLYSNPDRTHTDIAAALRLALAAFPSRSNKQIVLLSDGNENLGGAAEQALSAASGNIKIQCVPLRSELKSEALLERATLPAEAKVGEPFELKVVARSQIAMPARLRVLRSGKPAGERVVSLSPGKNVVTFPQTIPEAGFYTYRVLIEPERDTISENNSVVAFARVRGKPRLLYIEGQPSLAGPLERALRSHEIAVDRRGLAGLPTSLAECRNYDAILFSEVPALALAPEQMKLVQAAVRDLGIGFGMLGGEEGFGAGGYFDTPIEETLPVDTSIKKHKVMPSLAVVIIIDNSGSMGMIEDGVEKIRLANEAAIAVVQTLQKIDQVGVVAGGGIAPSALTDIRPVSEKSALVGAIASLRAGGGGIYCQPSLKLAYEMIRPVKSRLKHLLLLADGSDSEVQEGCRELAALMHREKITLSTVSFGIAQDTPFLEEISRIGGGNFYVATRARDLPRIFTKDTMLMGKSLFIEEPFRPKVDTGEEVVKGVAWDTVPPLLGYVATSAKPLASLPLRSHKDDPILATWRYGLGRSVAFTSDAKARWGAHWLGWQGYGQLWPQIIRWMMKRGVETRLQTVVDIDQGKGRIAVDALDPSGGFMNFLDLRAGVVTPSLRRIPLRLDQTGPGRYEASFEAREIGAYLATVSRQEKGRWEAEQTSGAVVSYPPEYADLEPNDYLLTRLAETTGGKVGLSPDRVFRLPRKAARFPQDIWHLLVLLAALLLPLDVAVRRLMLDWRQVANAGRRAWAWARRRTILAPTAGPTQQPTLGRLLAGKEARQAERTQSRFAMPPPSVAPDLDSPLAQPTEQPSPPSATEAAPEPQAEQTHTSRLLRAKRRTRMENKD